MKTFKLFAFLILLVSPCVAAVVSDPESHVVHLKHSSGSSDDSQKSGFSVPIECCLLNDLSTLCISSNSLATSALVVLESMDTGAQTQSTIYLSRSNSYINILYPGEYYLSIILPDGTYFYGEFTLM